MARDIEAARSRYVPDADWTAESLALYTQAAIQGAFILAKAHGGAGIAAQCIAHLRRYVAMLLTPDGTSDPDHGTPGATSPMPGR